MASYGTDHRTAKRRPDVFEAKSKSTEEHLRRMPQPPDLVFQWEFFFAPFWDNDPQVPYFLYNDWTTRLTQREMPDWAHPDAYEPFHSLQVPLLQRAAHVFAFSHKMRASVIEDYGVPPERVTTVYTGVNFDEFPDLDIDKDYAPRRVLFVGNDYEVKGLPTLLKAFANVRQTYRDAQLDVVGKPASFDSSTYAMDGVTIHGEIQEESTLQALFREATVFALPSRMEAFGHVYAEAMAFGLPCLGNRQGAVPEIIDDCTTGYISHIDDVADWSEKLDAVLASAAVRRQLGRAGYSKASKLFDWDIVARRMTDTISASL
jgi:glycosyltransferase involved in cell wall biosynthesis